MHLLIYQNIRNFIILMKISRGQANGMHLNNAIGTIAPPIIGIPMTVGVEIGSKKANEIEVFAKWFTEKIMIPLLGEKKKK